MVRVFFAIFTFFPVSKGIGVGPKGVGVGGKGVVGRCCSLVAPFIVVNSRQVAIKSMLLFNFRWYDDQLGYLEPTRESLLSSTGVKPAPPKLRGVQLPRPHRGLDTPLSLCSVVSVYMEQR